MPALRAMRRRAWLKWPARFFLVSGLVFMALELIVHGGARKHFVYSGAFMAVSSLSDALDLDERWTKVLLSISMLLVTLSALSFLQAR